MIFPDGTIFQTILIGDTFNTDYPITLSNPAFWRHDPLSTSPIPKDIAASAGIWLLENPTDLSTASAVAAAFAEFQLPARHVPTVVLIRLRDTYMECFRNPGIDKHTRLMAVQSAAAYYVLYHSQLIWNTWKGLGDGIGKLPPDLFLHRHNVEWDGDDVFKHLHIDVEDRSGL